jgi:hypothetical protein|tara:strand:+ start:679 stop:927 length:249 start_codon:yes stop_codon:yes gene_type:complete
MNKSEITKNLKQIKKLLEEESPIIAKERIGFLINDIENERLYRSNQGRSDRQVESNYKVMEWTLYGLGIIVALLLLNTFLLG